MLKILKLDEIEKDGPQERSKEAEMTGKSESRVAVIHRLIPKRGCYIALCI